MAKMGKKIETLVSGAALAVSCTAFTCMVLSISLNVVCRYFLSVSFDWAEEISYLFFNWAVFLGVTVVYKHQGLIAIDVVVSRLPERLKKAAMVFNFFLIFVITVSLVIWGYRFSINGWIRKTTAIGIRYFFYDMAIPVSSIILAGYSLKFLILTIKGKKIESSPLENRS
jgi:TRAP-type C4-dicarboxylate transport system permease small subunit